MIDAFVDGRLSADDHELMVHHISSCSECAAAVIAALAEAARALAADSADRALNVAGEQVPLFDGSSEPAPAHDLLQLDLILDRNQDHSAELLLRPERVDEVPLDQITNHAGTAAASARTGNGSAPAPADHFESSRPARAQLASHSEVEVATDLSRELETAAAVDAAAESHVEFVAGSSASEGERSTDAAADAPGPVSAAETPPTEAVAPAPDPIAVEPVVAEPIVAEPVEAEPVVAEAVVAEPIVAESIVAEPLSVEPPESEGIEETGTEEIAGEAIEVPESEVVESVEAELIEGLPAEPEPSLTVEAERAADETGSAAIEAIEAEEAEIEPIEVAAGGGDDAELAPEAREPEVHATEPLEPEEPAITGAEVVMAAAAGQSTVERGDRIPDDERAVIIEAVRGHADEPRVRTRRWSLLAAATILLVVFGGLASFAAVQLRDFATLNDGDSQRQSASQPVASSAPAVTQDATTPASVLAPLLDSTSVGSVVEIDEAALDTADAFVADSTAPVVAQVASQQPPARASVPQSAPAAPAPTRRTVGVIQRVDPPDSQPPSAASVARVPDRAAAPAVAAAASSDTARSPASARAADTSGTPALPRLLRTTTHRARADVDYVLREYDSSGPEPPPRAGINEFRWKNAAGTRVYVLSGPGTVAELRAYARWLRGL